jgi:hypothetical protein
MLVVGLLFDPCHLGEMPLTVLVDREGRIAISHAGVVDPLVFETDINALLAEQVSVQLILPTGANSSR